MNDLTHIDLFSGIGGFALAAQWAGFRTVCFCEIDKFCQEVLRKHWPHVPIHNDIRTFRWTGKARPILLSGGPPCQPTSKAGKRLGTTDDRFLWPDTLRIIAEAKPCWILLENPLGIESMGLFGILLQMENLGYQSTVLEIPAIAVAAPHIRERIWILAHANGIGLSRRKLQRSSCGKGNEPAEIKSFLFPAWPPGPSEIAGIPRVDDGVPRRVDRLKSLGNSIVPQIAFQIIKAIAEIERMK